MKTLYRHRIGMLLLVAALVPIAGCGSDKVSSTPIENCENGFLAPTAYPLEVPEVFPFYFEPPENPTTIEGVELGRRLFYDPILSGDRTQSCSSCHTQAAAFTDSGERTSEGIDGLRGDRNTPAIINVGWQLSLFWDGRAATPEEQARGPVSNPIEMHLDWDEAVQRLRDHADYPELFGAAFGTCEITETKTVQAIAQFERTLISANSKFDRFNRDEIALTPSEDRGFRLFFNERGDCFHCHGNSLHTDGRFHDIGLDLAPPDSGLSKFTGNPLDYGKFKTPTLRNIEFTAPYMHDGRFETLEEVVRHYDANVERSPNLDPLILARVDRDMRLTDQEIADVVAFLRTFSDSAFVTNPDFSDPFK